MVHIQENLRYSFYEISEILRYMPIEYNKKLPEKFKNLINENKISNGFTYNKNKTLDNQEMLQDTKTLLSILYRTYWCTEEKRKFLEEEDNNILTKKYNPENIFKNRKQDISTEKNIINSVNLVEYHESIFKKIIDKIKAIFKR